ncbi:unnamed protein product [Amoebophrya sp. A120]|nr:unnamed protein product [Amoebophrya sp. A120]|eukprot:GSA120T00004068001.1
MVQYHRVDAENPATADPANSPGSAAQQTNLQRLATPVPYGVLFFVAGVSAMFSAVLAALWFLIIPFAFVAFPLDFFSEIYLFFGGAMIAVLDAPLNFRWVVKAKIAIGKYCRLLTRISGRGIYLMFLSGLEFSAMYTEDIARTIGILIALYIAALGLVTLLLGAIKTRNLNVVRTAIRKRMSSPDDVQTILQFCRSSKERMTMDEFVEMSGAVAPSLKWSQKDLKHLFTSFNCEAPESAPTDTVAVEDLQAWLQPGAPMMM